MFFDDEPMDTPMGDDTATDTGAADMPAEENHEGTEASEAPAAE